MYLIDILNLDVWQFPVQLPSSKLTYIHTCRSTKFCSFAMTVHRDQQNQKYVRLRGLTYIHTCRSYVHTPRELDRHAVETPTGTFNVLHALVDSSDFGLLGEQSSPKCEIPCPGRRWTTVQNLTPLALSSVEKSSTVQTHKQKQTNNNRHIHTLPIDMCG